MKKSVFIIFMFTLCVLTMLAASLQSSNAAAPYYMTVYFKINGGNIRTDLNSPTHQSIYGQYSNAAFSNTYWYTKCLNGYGEVNYIGLDYPDVADAAAVNALSDGYVKTVISTEVSHVNLWNVGTFGWYKPGYHIEAEKAWRASKNGVTNYFNQNDISADNTVNPVTAYRLNGNQAMTKNDIVSLYANWILNTYTVAYDAGEGSGAPASQTKDHNKNITLSALEPARSGYEFTEWNTEEDGSGMSYDPGEVYSGNENITLYAQWKATEYTISYDLKGGMIPDPYPECYTVETATFTLKNPVRTGYVFSGWTGTDLGNSSPSENVRIEQGSTGNREYAAVWTKITKELTYHENGHGSITWTNPVTMDHFGAVTARSMDNADGYRFKGWAASKLKALAGIVDYASGSTIKAANTDPAGSSVPSDLYAVWEEIIYKVDVRFNAGGGTTDSGVYSLSGDMVMKEDSEVMQEVYATDDYFDLYNIRTFGLEKTGYHTEADKAWKLDEEDLFFNEDQTSAGGTNPVTSQRLNGGTEISNDTSVTLYANWIANTYSVRFNANGGSGSAYTQSGFIYDQNKNLADISAAGISAPEGNGGKWVFAGWSTDPEATSGYANRASVRNLTAVNGSIVDLYAVWRRPVVFRSGTAPKTSSAGYQYYNSGGVTSVTVPSDIVTEIGSSWTFTGWRGDSSAAAAETAGGAGASVTPEADTASSGTNYELYAVYSRSVYLKYDGNGADGGTTADSDEQTQYYNSGGGSKVSKPVFTHSSNGFERTGYRFENWDRHDDSNKDKYTWGPERDTGILYDTAAAVWKAETYVISFHPNGGSFGYDELAVTYDAAANNHPGTASLSGQVFQGWYTSGNEMIFDADGSCVEGSCWKNGKWHAANDISVYARWEEGKCFRVMFSIGKSGSSAPEKASTSAASDLDAGELDNVKGEGFQYELYRDIVPDGVQSSEPSLKLFGPSPGDPSASITKKYHTRSLAFQPGGIASSYHYIGSLGIAAH